MELLLLSNSTNYGGTMFSHAAEAFAGVSAGDRVTFIPYALADWDDYAERVTRRSAPSTSRSSRRTGRARPTGRSSKPTSC